MWDRSSVLFTEKALGHYSRYVRYRTTVTTVTTVTYGHRTLVPGAVRPRGPQKNFIEIYAKFGYKKTKLSKEIWVSLARNSGLGQATRAP